MLFAQRLKEVRTSQNISQSELARQTGIGATTIAEYERGISQPGAENLIKIAKIFNVSLDYFLGLSPNKELNPDTPINMINFKRPRINGEPVTDKQLEKMTKMMALLIEMIEDERTDDGNKV